MCNVQHNSYYYYLRSHLLLLKSIEQKIHGPLFSALCTLHSYGFHFCRAVFENGLILIRIPKITQYELEFRQMTNVS